MSADAHRRPWLGLGVTLLTQILATLTLSAAPVLAPAVAPGLGLAPERVGLFTGLAYAVAMASGLASGSLVARWGATRITLAVLACMALSLSVMVAGHPAMLLFGAAIIGLGYGIANPAAADILGRHAPVRAAGLFFALKQAGVPIGVALAGLLLPLGLVWVGWRTSALALAAVSLAALVLMSPAMRPLQSGPDASGARPTHWRGSLLAVWQQPALRTLSLVSLAFGVLQTSFLTFVVALLHLERGLPLALAAGMLSASQAACVFTRVFLGHAADRWVTPRLLLASLGMAMAASCLALGLLPASAPVPLVAVIVVATGATVMGWNGVFFAQLVRSVPREALADSAGATQVFVFGGAMLGPLAFSGLLHLGVTHSQSYMALAGLGAAAGLLMLLAPQPRVQVAEPGRPAPS
jgi:MFS family permease